MAVSDSGVDDSSSGADESNSGVDDDEGVDLDGEASGSEVVLGWREWISFPEWGIEAMKAKIDTGARTSAIHAADIETFERDGADWVSFTAHPWQRNDDDARRVEALVIDERDVTSSSGTTSRRIVVRVTIDLAGEPHEVELTLTRRDDMGFRMLLGREAMRGRYLVDPSRSYLTGRPSARIRNRNRRRPAEGIAS